MFFRVFLYNIGICVDIKWDDPRNKIFTIPKITSQGDSTWCNCSQCMAKVLGKFTESKGSKKTEKKQGMGQWECHWTASGTTKRAPATEITWPIQGVFFCPHLLAILWQLAFRDGDIWYQHNGTICYLFIHAVGIFGWYIS